jgi:hypothetical protein
LEVRYAVYYSGLLGAGAVLLWYAALAEDDGVREFLQRKAKHWAKLAVEKELEVRLFARIAV